MVALSNNNSLKSATISDKKGSTKVRGIFRDPKKLSKTEMRFLDFIRDGIIARKSLSVCAKCSLKNVDKYLTKLRKKGIIDINNNLVAIGGGTMLPSGGRGRTAARTTRTSQNTIKPTVQRILTDPSFKPQESPLMYRIHSQQFRIRILYKSTVHEKHIGTIHIDNNEVRVWRDVIEIYANKNREFIAEDIYKATEQSLEYWSRIIGIIQNDTRTLLIKERSQNIELVKEHYAQIGNELAQDIEIRGDKLQVYATEDGKLWLLVDYSHGTPEFETTRADTGKPDMEKVIKHFQDMRDNDPPTLSEILAANKDTANNLKEISAGMVLIINPKKSTQEDPGTGENQGNKPKKYDDIYKGYA